MWEPLFSFSDTDAGHFDDYVSGLAVYPDRVEFTLGWREPRSAVILAGDIAWVRKGAFAQKNVITIMCHSDAAYELVATWDADAKMEIVAAMRSIIVAGAPGTGAQT